MLDGSPWPAAHVAEVPFVGRRRPASLLAGREVQVRLLERAGAARARVRGALEPEHLLVGAGELALVLVDQLLGRGPVAATAAAQARELGPPLLRLDVLRLRASRSTNGSPSTRSVAASTTEVARATPPPAGGARRVRRPPRPASAGGGPAGRTIATTGHSRRTPTGSARRGRCRAPRRARRPRRVRRARPRGRARRGPPRNPPRRRRPARSRSGATSTTGSRRSPRTNASSSAAREASARCGADRDAPAAVDARDRVDELPGPAPARWRSSAGVAPHLRVARLERSATTRGRRPMPSS